MSLASAAVFNSLVSHVAATGLFRRVNTAEPKSAPSDSGLTSAIWMDRVLPYGSGSGLQRTTAVTVYMIRIYNNMLEEPTDAIDPAVLAATDTIMTALHGDFELGGNAMAVDIFGMSGVGLSAQAGYINQDNRLFRVMDITVPVIVSDAWTQTP